MKTAIKNIRRLVTLTALLGISACSKDFLEEHPKTFLSPQGFYKNAAELQMGLNSIYRAPHDRYSDMWGAPCWFEWATDIAYLTPANNHAYHNEASTLRNDFNSASGMPWSFWSYMYNHIKDVNFLLKALPDVAADEKIKKEIEGQARAWRAHIYFDGVRLFGSIPLILEPVSDVKLLNSYTRVAPEKVYEQIIADLIFAKDNLPTQWSDSKDFGRITSGGCAALLARIYITMAGYPLRKTEKWHDARQILKEFIEDKRYGGHYGLFEEYDQVFDPKNIPGKEGVWTINFAKGTFGQGSQLHTDYSPIELYYDSRAGLARGGGWSNALPTDAFLTSYDKAKDKRYKFTYWTSTADIPDEYADINNSATGPIVFSKPHVKKFREKTPNDNSQGSGIDHYIIRYADVLLMYAEALNELNDNNAYTYINMVRKRAGLEDLSQMSQQQFRDHMLLERAWELCFEGERRFDLTRMGVYYERVKAWNPQAGANIVKGKHELWPIPQREIDINPALAPNNPQY